MRRTNRFRLILVVGLLVGWTTNLGAEEVQQSDEGWFLNLPAGWELENANPKQGTTTFVGASRKVITQVFAFPPAQFQKPPTKQTAQAVAQSIVNSFKATIPDGGQALFEWQGADSAITELTWAVNGQKSTQAHGYLLTVAKGAKAYAVLAYSAEADWGTFEAFHLSIIDSFALSQEDWYQPGPVSAFLGESAQTSQDLIEREALVLQAYSKAAQDQQMAAWKRFYQLIYRDNYERITAWADDFQADLVQRKIPLSQHPAELAKTLQNWQYERPGGLSDLLSPVSAVKRQTGDCDARGLVFMIALKHWGINSVLMISPKFQHSLVGLDLPGNGARFPYQNKQYLVTELTAKVAIGLIEQSMSDPKDWIGMDLVFRP